MRKLPFGYAKIKRGNWAADQCLCFCYIDSTITLLFKSEISICLQSSEAIQSSLCWTWSETKKKRFCRDVAHMILLLEL